VERLDWAVGMVLALRLVWVERTVRNQRTERHFGSEWLERMVWAIGNEWPIGMVRLDRPEWYLGILRLEWTIWNLRLERLDRPKRNKRMERTVGMVCT